MSGKWTTSATKMLGVLGDPVAHSLSPAFQNYFLRQAGIDAVYLAWRVRKDRLPVALAGLHALSAAGLNITVPHKEAALSLAANATQAAQRIGAANTLIWQEEGWLAENTDWRGFQRAATALDDLEGATVLLFGAGGVARAVAYACAQADVARLLLCNRTGTRAQALAQEVGRWNAKMRIELIDWHQHAVQRAAKEADGIVQGTSIGLHGEDFPFALPGKGWAMDCVYCPDGRTPFVRIAAKAGRQAEDGLRMLIEQGAEAFACWFGQRPDARKAYRWLARRLGRIVEEAA